MVGIHYRQEKQHNGCSSRENCGITRTQRGILHNLVAKREQYFKIQLFLILE